ncbi:MAG: hypothetical protein IT167_07995 [Bryobacterales bacterium]|nr:hypothetical protein [Bryobacterales bacterium]
MWRYSLLLAFLFFPTVAPSQPSAGEYFKITVIDAATGRGVPLVELKTTNDIVVHTDSNGIIAWNEPGLMDRDVYFSIRSHGYRFPGDGRRLRTTRGGSIVLKVERVNIAERLYRITGQGIYRDSILTGMPAPLRNPVLNGEVMGQDTVFATPYRGKIFWLWDDTHRAAGALGSLEGCAATSELPANGGLDPSVGVDLNYIVDDSGFCKRITPFPIPGMKWKYWAVTVRDERGAERLAIGYGSMRDLGVAYEYGLAVFNDEKEEFERVGESGKGAIRTVPTHPCRASVRGTQYFYFPGPLPDVRVRAEFAALADRAAYEAYTCLAPGSRYEKGGTHLDRAPDGKLRYGWKRNTPPLDFSQEKELIQAGKMKPSEALFHLRDILTGGSIKPHAGSVSWNAHRARWIMIVQEDRGLADNGEIWYAEADTPVGPWVYARKVVTHDKYTFYNPTQHPFFDQQGGRLVYFEGTYSDTLSGSPVNTPRYDYNQIMYRLDLDDPRLFLPAPVYHTRDGRYLQRQTVDAEKLWDAVEDIPFFAQEPHRRITESIRVSDFYALPVQPLKDLSGRWKCTFRDRGAGKYPGELVIDGGKIAGNVEDLVLTYRSFDGLSMVLEAGTPDELYVITGKPAGAKLAGHWNRPGTTQEGSWECEREAPPSDASPDLVPLYEYRSQNGAPIYSTVRRSGTETPIARVWKNPASLLLLDREARPSEARH